MLVLDLSGAEYVKAHRRIALAPRLDGRTKASIERKHCNISAVLVRMGLPYVDGYKPLGHFQAKLRAAVEEYIAGCPDFFDRIEDSPRLNPEKAPDVPVKTSEVFVPPPDRVILPEESTLPWRELHLPRVDYVQRDEANRRLGRLGEEFVLGVEKRRLLDASRDDLAAKVEWVSRESGDSAGFDVLSFDARTDAEKMIEVKTTGLGKEFPFYVTSNEKRCSETYPDKYQLYRVFDFARNPRVYMLPGALSDRCRLSPILYRAGIG